MGSDITDWSWVEGLADTAVAGLLVGGTLVAVALVLAVRAWLRTARRRSLRMLLHHEDGSAMLEFVLVFPIVLGLVLILLQTTLVMAGQLFVHYAAFTATRSAMVYGAMDQSDQFGQPRNMIVTAPGWPKFDAIRHSAFIAVMPVSGELSSASLEQDPLDGEVMADALSHYFVRRGDEVPAWVHNKVADRLRYAQRHTDVTLMHTEVINGRVWFTPLAEGELFALGPREPMTVRVRHRLNLSIPYARAVFADGRHDGGGGGYTNVTGRYTLSNQGDDPELPDPPDLPRRDRMDDDI